MYGQKCGRGPCTTFALPPTTFFAAGLHLNRTLQAQKVRLLCHGVSLLHHFILKSFFFYSILAVALLLPSTANKRVH